MRTYWIVIFTLIVWSARATAIDNSGLTGRFGLVGVISDDSTNGKHKTPGVAVLKDRNSGVTMTLKTGESVPYEANLKITGVRRNLVTITDGKTSVQVTYVGSSFDEEPPKPKAETSITDLTDPIAVRESLLNNAEPEKSREREAVNLDPDTAKPRFITPGWIESNSVRITSEYLPLEEIDEENFEFEE